MKHTARFLALILALATVMAFSLTFASAANITITNAPDSASYTLYKIFTLESHSGDNYSYKVTDDWAAFFEASAAGAAYFKVVDGYATAQDGIGDSNMPAFAAAALAWADKPAGITANASGGTAVWTNQDAGYYLIDTTTGTLFVVNTYESDVQITDKNKTPGLTKEVQEDSKAEQDGNGWGDKNDADFGQTVNFKITVTIAKGAKNYYLEDTLTHMTYVGDTITVTYNGTTVDSANNYTFTKNANGDGFTLLFLDGFLSDKESGDIVVTYSATVDQDATIGTTGNKNEVTLKYGENHTITSDTKHTTTYVWETQIFKYTGANKTPLPNAVFNLYRDGHTGENDKLLFDASGKYVASGGSANLTSGSDGMIKISGLDGGKYILKEKTAPTGYNKITADIPFEISSTDGKLLTGDGINTTDNQVEIKNDTGALLPETGARGTKALVAIGSILVLVSVVFLVTKKKMSTYEA